MTAVHRPRPVPATRRRRPRGAARALPPRPRPHRSARRSAPTEDQVIQSMADVSPTKWHRGHTTWFFETFLLEPTLTGYDAFDPDFRYLFNSYYEAVGPRHPRSQRGLLSRPTVDEVARYRAHVDAAMEKLIDRCDADAWPDSSALVVLGLHHEQQHQELLLMDIKHVLSNNPLDSRLRRHAAARRSRRAARCGCSSTRRPRRGRPRRRRRRVRVRQRVAAPQGVPRAVPHRRPARDRGRVARVHRRRRLPPARALALRRLVRGAGARVGRAAVLARRRRRRLVGVHARRPAPGRPERAGRAREPLRSRRVRALVAARACPPSSSGSTRSRRCPPTGGLPDTAPRRARLHPRPRPATPGSRRRSATCGSGRRARTSPTRASHPRPARSVSTTASS